MLNGADYRRISLSVAQTVTVFRLENQPKLEMRWLDYDCTDGYQPAQRREDLY